MYPAIHYVLITVFCVGLAQAVYLIVFLLASRGPKRAGNGWLAALLAALAACILCQLLLLTSWYRYALEPTLVLGCALFLIGPFLYLYIRKITTGTVGKPFVLILHLAPFAANVALLLALAFVAKPELLAQLDPRNRGLPEGIALYPAVKTAYLILYGVFSLAALASYRRRLKDQYSSVEKIDLVWLSVLCLAYMAMLGGVLALNAFAAKMDALLLNADSLVIILITAIVFVIGHMWLRYPDTVRSLAPASGQPEPSDAVTATVGLGQAGLGQSVPEREPEAANEEAANEEAADAEAEPVDRYREARLGKEESAALALRVRRLMEENEPHREQELKLAALARLARASPHELSQAINENCGQNFFDFVNSYRVATAMQLLRSPEAARLSILDIAFESGFNSKAAFNRAFAKHARATPSHYRAGKAPAEDPAEDAAGDGRPADGGSR